MHLTRTCPRIRRNFQIAKPFDLRMFDTHRLFVDLGDTAGTDSMILNVNMSVVLLMYVSHRVAGLPVADAQTPGTAFLGSGSPLCLFFFI